MSKKPFVQRVHSPEGFSPRGCFTQYLHEYFWVESMHASKLAEELHLRAIDNIKLTTTRRTQRVTPSIDHIQHEEQLLLESQAYAWLSKMFDDFRHGINVFEESNPIDFNEVFDPEMMIRLIHLFTTIRMQLESGVHTALEQINQKSEGNTLDSNYSSSTLSTIKTNLAKIKLPRDYQSHWGDIVSRLVTEQNMLVFEKLFPRDKDGDAGSVQII